MTELVDVPGWPRPRGYNNGAIGRGRVLHVAGQIGWNARQEFETTDLIDQFGVALDNVLAVVRAAGGDATDIAELTVYVTDVPGYRLGAARLGAVYKARMGTHYPAMALVGVTELVEPRAQVEIQAVAYLPETP
jgi:enamine deaminase RidA (YjgF/YER057c/UK114 family)